MKTFSFNSIPNCICIYKIYNTINEKVYIGSTTNLNSRIIQHRYDLKNRTNNCPKLYKDIELLGSNNFKIDILEEFDNISITELHNIESQYIIKYNSIENGYNERLDIDGKFIENKSISDKMSESGKNCWKNGVHKDHAKKLSKFKYNVYDKYNKLLEENILIKDITKKYEIASSNIFTMIKRMSYKLYDTYDETKTFKIYIKNFYVERIYIGGTKRGEYKSKFMKDPHKYIKEITFSFNKH